MNRYYLKIHALIIFVIAILLLLSSLSIINNNYFSILIYSFIIYGIIGLYLSINYQQLKLIILFTGLYILGITFWVIENFYIHTSVNIYSSVLMSWIGISLIMIFISNPLAKPLLYSGIFLTLSAFCIAIVWRQTIYVYVINSYLDTILSFWYIVLFVLGLLLFEKKR